MFTICIAVYASMVAVDPVTGQCYQVGKNEVNAAVSECKVLDKDPFTTCEVRRVGALKWFITIRRLEGV